MVRVTIERIYSNENATMGLVYLDGVFFCFCLEDGPREEKVAGKTRIPAGVYKLVKCFKSALLKRMQANGWYKKEWIPTISGVPGFSYIRIHSGVTHEHTDGCPLFGFSANSENLTIGHSRHAISVFVNKLDVMFEQGDIFIEIIDDVPATKKGE